MENNKSVTGVEWLVEKIETIIENEYLFNPKWEQPMIEQAKEIERQKQGYSEEEVGNIANWAFGFYRRNDLSDSELEDEFNRILVEQFKKKSL